jgi:hypothetical protein
MQTGRSGRKQQPSLFVPFFPGAGYALLPMTMCDKTNIIVWQIIPSWFIVEISTAIAQKASNSDVLSIYTRNTLLKIPMNMSSAISLNISSNGLRIWSNCRAVHIVQILSLTASIFLYIGNEVKLEYATSERNQKRVISLDHESVSHQFQGCKSAMAVHSCL